MAKRTIKVDSQFGEKEVTKQEFINRWKEHATGFYRLVETQEHYNKAKEIKEWAKETAGEVFEILYKSKNK